MIARIIGERLSALWGSPVVIENKPGAGGNIAATQVVKSTPDGSEILVASVSIATNHNIFSNLGFDPFTDLAPISFVTEVPNALLLSPQLKAGTVAEFIALAKANPGKLTYGSAGIGTSAHLATEYFCLLTGTSMTHVPYRGTAAALNDLMGGRIDVLFDILTAAIPQIKAKSVQCLGVTSPARTPLLADYAPVGESVPGYEASTWNAMFVAAATPAEIRSKIAIDVQAVLREPAVKAKLAELAVEAVGSSPEELAVRLRKEADKYAKVITAAGIRL